MESAGSMMYFAGLPNNYWGEAVVAAAYIRNSVPTRAFSERVSPYERWYSHRTDLKHFKVIECVAYAHMPDSQRNKL
uniref:Integrase catalytic domain-containing protein n=1 Tax=Amphimedon queenslandica TaxID=400682 RepID=A0A1X7TKT5_AMPQE